MPAAAEQPPVPPSPDPDRTECSECGQTLLRYAGPGAFPAGGDVFNRWCSRCDGNGEPPPRMAPRAP